MLANGDNILSMKYTIFSLVNFIILITLSVSVIISYDGSYIRRVKYDVPKNLVLNIVGFAIIMIILIFMNDAGYENKRRILIYPQLGRGEFYFIRDTFLYSGIVKVMIEIMTMGCILYWPANKEKWRER